MFSLHQILVCGCGLYVNCTLKANYLLPSSAFVFFSVNDSLNVGSPEFLSVVICKLNRLFLRFSQVFVVRLVPDVTKISFDEPVFYHFLLRAMHNDYRHIQVLTTYVRFLQAPRGAHIRDLARGKNPQRARLVVGELAVV